MRDRPQIPDNARVDLRFPAAIRALWLFTGKVVVFGANGKCGCEGEIGEAVVFTNLAHKASYNVVVFDTLTREDIGLGCI